MQYLTIAIHHTECCIAGKTGPVREFSGRIPDHRAQRDESAESAEFVVEHDPEAGLIESGGGARFADTRSEP